MPLLLVQVLVKTECIESFKAATELNVAASLREPGVSRFELLQKEDDPSSFVLVEEYRSQEAVLSHKETAHYKSWRDTVAGMMAQPRIGTRYTRSQPEG